MTQEIPSGKLRLFGLGYILPYAKNFRKTIFLMLGFRVLNTASDIVFPLFEKYVLDEIIGAGRLEPLPWFVLLYAGMLVLTGGCNYVTSRLCAKVEYGVKRDLRNTVFDHLQTLSLGYFNRNSVGKLHARVLSDTSSVGELLSWQLADLLWNVLYLAGSVAVMLSIRPKLSLMVFSVVPLLAFLFTLFQKKLVELNRELRDANAKITSDFNEGITGAKTIKTLGMEQRILRSFLGDTADIQAKSMRSARIHGLFAGTMDFASSLALAIVLWKGGYMARTEVGTFSMFMAYAQGMMEPVRWLIESISDLTGKQVNIERLVSLLETKSDVQDTPEVVAKYGDTFAPKRENWEELRGDLEFQDVTFRYPDGDEEVLQHFSLHVPFGSSLAIVGETGAGKSTLVNLVCRFFEPTAGRILLDGRDLRERSQLWLHASLGYVLQTPHLFSGTVRDNLLYGKPDATEEEMWQALRTVSAQDVVNRMEKGLDSDVGEGGDRLSAGEKQLLSFARALLADPKILILDEATASVDTMTEQKILAALETAMQNRTTILIAHRLSTVRQADTILVVKNGRIIEQGSHADLMRKRGYYHSLYTRQYEDEATTDLFREEKEKSVEQ